jgi:sodium/proline symporter
LSTNLIVFGLYALLIGLVTLAAYLRTHSHADYILGGRSLNAGITAMGVAASDTSSWLMLSLPALAYLTGLASLWVPMALLLGGYLNWVLVAPRLRVYTEVANNSLTLPAYFENRFSEPAGYLRYVAAIIFVIFFTVYAASGLVGGAKLFQAAFDLEYINALWIVAPIVIFYSMLGGYFAVNWLDLFQSCLMLFALMILPIIAFGDFGGMANLMFAIEESAPDKSSLFDSITFLGLISSLAWGLGYFGQPHILVRFMSSRDNQSVALGRRIWTLWMFFALISAISVGYFGIAYFPAGTLLDPELVLPELAELLLNPWLLAIVFAAIASAIMSTVAAVLLSAGSSLVNDFYRRVLRPHASNTELVWIGRLCVLSISIVAVLLATLDNPSIFTLVSHAWGGLGAAFGPLVLVSLFSRNMNKYCALLGMLFGGGTALIWDFLHYYVGGIFLTYELAPAFVMGLIGIRLGYYFGKPNAQAQQQFDQMKINLKK